MAQHVPRLWVIETDERMAQRMNRRYLWALLVIGAALALGSSTLNISDGLSGLGLLLAIFAVGALLWATVRNWGSRRV
jgi:hypothetical protein